MKKTKYACAFLVLLASLGLGITPVFAQRRGGSVKTDTLFQKEPVRPTTLTVDVIWYGNWSANPTAPVVLDFLTRIGVSSYDLINMTYANAESHAPSGGPTQFVSS